MYTNVGCIGITGLYDGRTYRVTIRDTSCKIVRDDTGEPEQQDLPSKTRAEREAKRLAKHYNVPVRVI